MYSGLSAIETQTAQHMRHRPSCSLPRLVMATFLTHASKLQCYCRQKEGWPFERFYFYQFQTKKVKGSETLVPFTKQHTIKKSANQKPDKHLYFKIDASDVKRNRKDISAAHWLHESSPKRQSHFPTRLPSKLPSLPPPWHTVSNYSLRAFNEKWQKEILIQHLLDFVRNSTAWSSKAKKSRPFRFTVWVKKDIT